MAAIEAQFGAVTILVNNAGITRDNLLLRMKDEEWDAVMATNLKPVFRLAKAVLRGMMKARQGRIIHIGSVVGSSGNAGQANYAAAKAALIGFTKSLAQEVGSRNITVNCVAPGFVDTDMTRGLPEAARRRCSPGFRSAASARPRTSPTRWRYLAGPGAAMSRARRCTSTAGCTWRKSTRRNTANWDRSDCGRPQHGLLVESRGLFLGAP